MAVATNGEQLLKSYDATGSFNLWIKLLAVEVPVPEEGMRKQDEKSQTEVIKTGGRGRWMRERWRWRRVRRRRRM